MDLRYKQDGAPSSTTYTVKNQYATALGVNLGNNFFNSYCTVARWVK